MLVVTTPRGTVGSEVVHLLADDQIPFRVAARQPDVIHRTYGERVSCVQFDFDDPSTWSTAFADMSILFLVVPKPDPKVVRDQIIPLINVAAQSGCQHIIYLSVPGADRIKIIPHYQIERSIEASGIPYTFLRATYFMQNLCGKSSTHGVDIATRHEIFIPAGRGELSFIHVRDIAHVVRTICERPHLHKNKAYTLTGLEHLNFFQVANIFTRVMGHEIRYTHPSIPHFWLRMTRRRVPLALRLFMCIEYTVVRFGKMSIISNDLTQLLGRTPTTMEQFVEENKVRWLKQLWV